MYYIGYCRVSSKDNRQLLGLEVQKVALNFCDELIVEQASGDDYSRHGLKKALRRAKQKRLSGPVTLCIYRLDRLTRNMFDLVDLITQLNQDDIYLLSHCEQLETNTLTGRLLLLVLGYVAEMELEAIRHRTREGLKQARAKGVHLGRPSYPVQLRESVCQAYWKEQRSVQEISDRFGISRSTVYRMIRKTND